MAFTEFVIPTLKTDPATEAAFINEIAPFLVSILEKHSNPPKFRFFGKILLENGNDVSKDFRLCVGLGTSLLPLSLHVCLSHSSDIYVAPQFIPLEQIMLLILRQSGGTPRILTVSWHLTTLRPSKPL